MHILIAPDKFKGTLRAREAAEAIADGWREVRPRDELQLLPMSDGGDGFGEIIGESLDASLKESAALNAAHEAIPVRWWWSEATRTAIVESASVIGLAMLPPGKFHPFELDTLGLGELLARIAEKHAGAKLVLGLGGSATNDAGFGMARGLGYRFSDGMERSIEGWTELDRLQRIEAPSQPGSFSEVIVATDVHNPLLGPLGASRVYGPQKGLRPEDFAVADRCFERLADVVKRDLRMDSAGEPGTGAAGGLGYGARVFLGGHFEPGFEVFARTARLLEKIDSADLVITGEGAIDSQTAMGKGTGAVAQLTRARKKRCLGLAALLPDGPAPACLFENVFGIVPDLASAEEARRNAAFWLRQLAVKAAAAV